MHKFIKYLNGNIPTPELVTNYIYENVNETRGLIFTAHELTLLNLKGKYDSMQKLKLHEIVINIAEELYLADCILNTHLNCMSLISLNANVLPSFGKILTRVSNVAKYSKYNHTLSITYTPKLK